MTKTAMAHRNTSSIDKYLNKEIFKAFTLIKYPSETDLTFWDKEN